MNNLTKLKQDQIAYAKDVCAKKKLTKKVHKVKVVIDVTIPYESLEPKDIGYVYFIKCVVPEGYVKNLVKIGQTTNVATRLLSLQTGNPFSLVVHKTIESSEYKKIEHALHKKFKDKRINLEWFDVTDTEIDECILLYKDVKII